MDYLAHLRYALSVRFYFEDKAFGPGMAALLKKIEETGSLQGAAASMGMAYSKAWKIMKNAESQWGFALTRREAGGKDGGGSALTKEAREILDHYDCFMKEAGETLDALFARHFSMEWISRLRQADGETDGEITRQRVKAIKRRG